MDSKLAAFYGTNTPDEADVEKLAAAELAEGLAGEDSVDLKGLSDEQLEAAAQEILADGEETEETASGDEETDEAAVSEPEGDAQEKLAEADYLGRVMAHAYVQELKSIDKTAAGEAGAAKGMGKVLGHLRNLGGKAKSMGAAGAAKAKHHAGAAKAKAMAAGGKAKEHVKAHGKKYSAGAGLAAGAGAAHMAHKHKKASAVDTLVEARIAEILEASGIDPTELTQVEKTSAADTHEALAQTVEQRAWETLAQFGVVPAEETEEAAE